VGNSVTCTHTHSLLDFFRLVSPVQPLVSHPVSVSSLPHARLAESLLVREGEFVIHTNLYTHIGQAHVIFWFSGSPAALTLSSALALPSSAHSNSVLSSLFRCSQRNRCERADEPYRFAASLNQCVKATVYPDSIAVSEPSLPVSSDKHTHTHTHMYLHSTQNIVVIAIPCKLDNEKNSSDHHFTHVKEAELSK